MKEMNINLNVGDFCEGYFASHLLPEITKEIERIKKVIVNKDGYLDEVMESEFDVMEFEVRGMCEEHDSKYRRICEIENDISDEIHTWNESNQLTHIKV